MTQETKHFVKKRSSEIIEDIGQSLTASQRRGWLDCGCRVGAPGGDGACERQSRTFASAGDFEVD
jgi:hypothetical protein